MKVEFHTNTYERSHDSKPKGRGGWAFIVMDGSREHETVFAPGSTTLAEAKKWMRSYCKENYAWVNWPHGVCEVEVAPLSLNGPPTQSQTGKFAQLRIKGVYSEPGLIYI